MPDPTPLAGRATDDVDHDPAEGARGDAGGARGDAGGARGDAGGAGGAGDAPRAHGASTRRRRPVADWGGDELFNRAAARRRFTRDDGSHDEPEHHAPDPRRPRDHARSTEAAGAARAERSRAHASERGAAEPRRTIHIGGHPEDRYGARPPSRRPPRRAHERVGARPERIAAWAFGLGLLLVLIAVATADAATRLGDRTLERGMVGRDVRQLQTRLVRLGMLDVTRPTARFGPLTQRAVRRYQRSRCLAADGVAGPRTIRAIRRGRERCRRRSGGSSRTRVSRAYRKVELGARELRRGMAGRDVRTLQRLLRMESTGFFGPRTARRVRRFQRRADLAGDGRVGPLTRAALARLKMRGVRTTWYGPGLFGNRTACGQRLTRSLHGVAHRRLPCGTRVTLYHGGRFATARVVDRGPYAHGASLDLTAATARQLGFTTTADLRAAF